MSETPDAKATVAALPLAAPWTWDAKSSEWEMPRSYWGGCAVRAVSYRTTWCSREEIHVRGPHPFRAQTYKPRKDGTFNVKAILKRAAEALAAYERKTERDIAEEALMESGRAALGKLHPGAGVREIFGGRDIEVSYVFATLTYICEANVAPVLSEVQLKSGARAAELASQIESWANEKVDA